MDAYLDMVVRGNPEVNAHQVLGVLYTRLHRTLASAQISDVGVSFPKHAGERTSIGNVLRLHGTERALQALMGGGWHRTMSDLVEALPIASVPPGAAYQVVRRVQPKSSVERLLRRAMKRKGLTEAEARAAYAGATAATSELPYLQLVSASNGEHFRLFVEQAAVTAPRPGKFTSYGLGSTATDGPTVPRF